MRSSVLVIPCFDEARRLDPARVGALAENGSLAVLLVDDGSRDGTFELLRTCERAHPGVVHAMRLEVNQGKGEAVRQGLLAAIAKGATIVGYADADFSTEPDELIRLHSELKAASADGVLGSRVARLGAHIDRSAMRHYLGRVFASLAAVAVGENVYDTQCGAKWFRVGPALRRALSRPFESRWAFDVELLGRLLGSIDVGEGERTAPARLIEVPVRAWRDVGGSKLRPMGMARSLYDMARLIARARLGGK